MSHKLRFRSGQVQLQKVAVASATVITAGDLVYLDTNEAKPASAFAWTTDLATTQAGFADVFLGVAHESSAAGETADISVDVSPLSIYEWDVAAAAFELGDKLGPNAASDELVNTELIKVTSDTCAVARAAEHLPNGSTKLRVMFASAYHTASANRNAAVG